MQKQKATRTKKTAATKAGEPFASLRNILRPHAKRFSVQADKPGVYMLETRNPIDRGRRMFLAGVRQGKNYTSFHLMGVYGCPELLNDASPELKRRMQGKSCFNFTQVDNELFEELAGLTAVALERFNENFILSVLSEYRKTPPKKQRKTRA
jgi:hypothetical protein